MSLNLMQALIARKRNVSACQNTEQEIDRYLYTSGKIVGKGATEKAAREEFEKNFNAATEKVFNTVDKLFNQYRALAIEKSLLALANCSLVRFTDQGEAPDVEYAELPKDIPVEETLIFRINWLREVQKNIISRLLTMSAQYGLPTEENAVETKYPEVVNSDNANSRWYHKRDPEGWVITQQWYDKENKLLELRKQFAGIQRILENEIASANAALKVPVNKPEEKEAE